VTKEQKHTFIRVC